jgi:hypothetical protein
MVLGSKHAAPGWVSPQSAPLLHAQLSAACSRPSPTAAFATHQLACDLHIPGSW